MIYRVKEVVYDGFSDFCPQYRFCFMWWYFYLDEKKVFCSSLLEATEYIKNAEFSIPSNAINYHIINLEQQ